MIKGKLRADLVESISFSSAQEAFLDLAIHASNVLVSGVVERAGPALTTMRRTNWGAVTSVGDDSPYVAQIKAVFTDVVPRLRQRVSQTNFKSLLLKLATELISKFQEGVCKQKKIVQAGAEQLLLDVNSLKSYLLQLHGVGLASGDGKPTVPGSYTSVVNTKIKHLSDIKVSVYGR